MTAITAVTVCAVMTYVTQFTRVNKQWLAYSTSSVSVTSPILSSDRFSDERCSSSPSSLYTFTSSAEAKSSPACGICGWQTPIEPCQKQRDRQDLRKIVRGRRGIHLFWSLYKRSYECGGRSEMKGLAPCCRPQFKISRPITAQYC